MLVEVRDLTKIYVTGKVEVGALQGIDLDIEQGEFVAIMGPSGSGKTTFMNIIGCLDRATAGTYMLSGQHAEGLNDDQLAEVRGQQIGFVFQTYNLLRQATALQNVELPLQYARVRNRRQRAMEALAKLGLADRAHHLPSELSGGEQQRVAIARSLVNEPSLILADEPTGNLDSRTGAEVMDLFCQLNQDGITMVLVTHDAGVASYARRLVQFLDGKVVSDEGVNGNGEMESGWKPDPREEGDAEGGETD